jgi:hypothetical protein
MPLLEMERPRPESQPGVGRPPTTGRAFLAPLRPERARLAALACRRRTHSEFCPRLLAAGTPSNALSPPRQLYRIADAHAPPACVRLHWAQDERASQSCRSGRQRPLSPVGLGRVRCPPKAVIAHLDSPRSAARRAGSADGLEPAGESTKRRAGRAGGSTVPSGPSHHHTSLCTTKHPSSPLLRHPSPTGRIGYR